MKDRPLRCYTRRLGDVVGFAAACGVENGRGAVVLDVGCGTGVALRQLHRQASCISSIGMSRSPWPGQVSSSRGVRYIYGDAGVRIPLRTASVDLVVSVATLRFVRDKVKLLEEGWRVLRPGGEMRLKLVTEVGDQNGVYCRDALCTVDVGGSEPISLRRYVLRHLPRSRRCDVEWCDERKGRTTGAKYVCFRKRRRGGSGRWTASNSSSSSSGGDALHDLRLGRQLRLDACDALHHGVVRTRYSEIDSSERARKRARSRR